MKITLIVVGKIKEAFYRDAVAEYVKRLAPYCRLQIVEVEDEPTRENMSPAQEQELLNKEGRRILQKIPKGSYVVALCIDGKQRDSEAMAAWMEELAVRGISHITMIIGGSVGLSSEVIQMADEKVSFSKLTFPHQLMRVILLEQIYRWHRIAKNEPYHK
jgi:23S rRNA (pseudouridine1915-N3)-methyltransferase